MLKPRAAPRLAGTSWPPRSRCARVRAVAAGARRAPKSDDGRPPRLGAAGATAFVGGGRLSSGTLRDAPPLEVLPWYTLTDDFDVGFGVSEWHGTNVFYRDDDDPDLPNVLHRQPRRRGAGQHLGVPGLAALGRQEDWEDSPEDYPRARPTTGSGATTMRRPGRLGGGRGDGRAGRAWPGRGTDEGSSKVPVRHGVPIPPLTVQIGDLEHWAMDHEPGTPTSRSASGGSTRAATTNSRAWRRTRS